MTMGHSGDYSHAFCTHTRKESHKVCHPNAMRVANNEEFVKWQGIKSEREEGWGRDGDTCRWS